MIERLIDVCARNRFLVFVFTLVAVSGGLYALWHIPLDAVPDLSDVQVIVSTDWEGRSPDLVEDQLTYPISTPSSPPRRSNSSVASRCSVNHSSMLFSRMERISTGRVRA